MKTVDLGRAQRVRRDSDATLWFHISCPYCETRGFGPDPSYHMGVGVVPGGSVKSKCLRCGGSLPRSTTFLLDGKTFRASGKRGTVRRKRSEERKVEATKIPGLPVEMLAPESRYRQRIAEVVAEKWPALDFEQVAAAGLRVEEGSVETFYCPVWTTGGWAWVERRLNREPKALNHGPRGVGFLRPVDPASERDWVWVEGWFDAVAVPPPYEAVVLRGVSYWPENMRGRVFIALDPDEAGRAAVRKMVPRLWASGVDVHLVSLDAGDPADCGTERLVAALGGAKKVESVKEFIEWLSRK